MCVLIVCIFQSVTHNFVLIGLLHLAEQLQNLHQVLFKASEYALRVLACSLMTVKTIHAVRDCVLGQLCAGTSHIVVIDVHHAELGLKLHSFRE